MKLLILLLTVLFNISAFASSIHIEVGSTRSDYNSFQIPNDDSNRINLPELKGTSYRITGYLDLGNDNTFYFLYAPLTLNYTTRSNSGFEFNGTNFSSGTETDVSYKFNSYRLGYLWNFGGGDFKYWVRFVGKMRDAEIEVSQVSTKQSFSNKGFVPLLGVGFHYIPSSIWSIYAHLDGSYAKQGSAL